MDVARGDRTITKVIKMLQEMVVKSKEDGEKDVRLYAKFKCFCDSNKEEKTKEIDDLGKQIELLGGQIGELKASTGKLSTENGQLMMAMQDNERARGDAQSMRDKANDAFVAEEADLSSAIDSMDQAIDTLSAIGADQTALVSLKGSVSKKVLDFKTADALKKASIFLTGKQRQTLTGFLQAPFTGEYQSQSGEIVGILKNMRDTFKTNLKSARAAESNSADSHSKFMKVKTEEYDKQKSVRESNNKVLGENDEAVGTKSTSKSEAEDSKASDEEFLTKLIKQCADKKAEFEDRKMVRANEEAAIAQAITILNSDEAFETMGAVKATTSGSTGPSFLQVGSVAAQKSVRQVLAKKLTKMAQKTHSLKLARIAVSLERENPFNKVVAELDAMLELINKEEKEDIAQKSWCDSEREENNGKLDDKKSDKQSLEGQMTSLADEIDNEETGLKKQIADEQTALAENRKAQVDETTDRGLENAAYQANIKNLVGAKEILGKATKVLKKFYDWLHAKQGPHHYEQHEGKDSGSSTGKRIPEASVEQLEDACSADPACVGFNTNGYLKMEIDSEDKFRENPGGSLYVKVYESESPVLLQKAKKEDPDMPDSFEEGSGDQSDKAGDVVGMLEFILEETKKEEDTAHTEEMNAQHEFEDTINDLKADEASSLDTIEELKEQLAEKEKSLEERTVDHAKVSEEKAALEAYLLKIKGGCDFITDNFDKRTENRGIERKGLETAKEELFKTPAYKMAKAEEDKQALGKCAEPCMPTKTRMDHAECQSCVEDVSIAGYCATHADAPGCEEFHSE